VAEQPAPRGSVTIARSVPRSVLHLAMRGTGMRLAPHLLRLSVMPRTQPPSQPRDAEDYKPERGDERISSARKLRQDAGEGEDDKDDAFDDDDAFDEDEDDEPDDDYYDYEAARTVEAASAADRGRADDPARRREDDSDGEDEDEDEALTEADIMEVLDLDDLKKMEGPDT
jgi:hypothetical protein